MARFLPDGESATESSRIALRFIRATLANGAKWHCICGKWTAAMVSKIEEEIESLLHAAYSLTGHNVPSLSEYKELIDAASRESEADARKHLQPWLGIFEFGLEWLSYLHVALYREIEARKDQQELKVPCVLVGSACSFGISLRQLCLQGFDTPARSLLRSYTETLFLCIAILYDKALGNEYANATEDSAVLQFWHTRASPKNLHRRICEIEKTMRLPDEMIAELATWRREEYGILSQAAHLSYLAAWMTVLPPGLGGDEMHGPGIFGKATSNSVRTISYATRTTTYFSAVSFQAVLGRTRSDNSLLVLDRDSEEQVFLVIGRDVLSKVTMSHWND